MGKSVTIDSKVLAKLCEYCTIPDTKGLFAAAMATGKQILTAANLDPDTGGLRRVKAVIEV